MQSIFLHQGGFCLFSVFAGVFFPYQEGVIHRPRFMQGKEKLIFGSVKQRTNHSGRLLTGEGLEAVVFQDCPIAERIGDRSQNQEGKLVDISDMGDCRAFHLDAGSLKLFVQALLCCAVVDKLISAHQMSGDGAAPLRSGYCSAYRGC